MNKPILAAAAFTLACVTVAGATPSLPVDERRTWRVAVAEFSGDGLSQENQYLLAGIPLILVETLAEIERHTLSEKEMSLYRERLHEDAVRRLQENLSELLKNRDELYFKRDTAVDERSRLTERIETAKDDLSALRSADVGTINVASGKPVEILRGADGALVPAVKFAPDLRAEDLDVDCLVWGNIDQIDAYLFISVKFLDPGTGSVQELATASSRERVMTAMEPIRETLTAVVLGRPWAVVRITTEPMDAGIWFDDRFVGRGEVSVDLVDVEVHSVRVQAPGYTPVETTVLPESGGVAVVDVTLPPSPSPQVTIDSNPPGATLYMGSMWAGTTPTTEYVPEVGAHAQLELEGYNRHLFSVGGDGMADVEKRLLPASVDTEEIVGWQRDGFYSSLGAFILSVPLPMILLDITNNLTYAFNNEVAGTGGGVASAVELERLVGARSAAMGGYFASVVVTVALGVRTVVELLEYLRVVDLSMN